LLSFASGKATLPDGRVRAVIVNSGCALSSISSAMMKPPWSVCVPVFSETSSLLGARSHGLTSTVTDRVMDADDENFHHKLNFEAALLFLAGRRWQPWVSLNLSCRKTEMISSLERILRLFGF